MRIHLKTHRKQFTVTRISQHSKIIPRKRFYYEFTNALHQFN